MKKKFIILILCVAMLTIWIFRFVYLNQTAEMPDIQIYEIGETVEYGDDYFNSSKEKRNGYKIIVRSASIVKYEDFAKSMQLELPVESSSEFRADYVYDVEVTIINEGNEEVDSGIDMFNTLLVTANMRLPIDTTLWGLLYPQLESSYTFKLRNGTQMDFHFPFTVETSENQKVGNLDYLQTKQFYLNISQYPIKKMIEIVQIK